MNNYLSVTEIFSSIQGEGLLAGKRQIFIRFSGCNLACNYCDTDFSQQDFVNIESAPGSGKLVQSPLFTVEKLLEIVAEWDRTLPRSHHSVSITGGEPLLHHLLLSEILPQLRLIMPIHLETNGILHDECSKIIEFTDYVSMDFKLQSASGVPETVFDKHCRFLKTASGSKLAVKVIVSEETTKREIDKVCLVINETDRSIPFFIQPVTTSTGSVAIKPASLLKLQAAASAILDDVRVMPQMHRLLGAL